MAAKNDTPTAYLYGLKLDLSGQDPREIREAAKNMAQAVEVALFEEKPDVPRTLECSERDSLIGLLASVRYLIDAADKIDQAKRRPVAV